ncbi:TrmH family RNA methyltransferase [Ferribacterium limneticum]|uniref:TrmH family RNA methyltransferase n=1 Tax=Ferribacterium limneticum TaxID=76259 RepID=UPI001CFB62F5|nr:RNA methyltransferase [Ferribacterium limneticum]UCV26950.1 RNA methyltransferase [Ferribacterium limneticum]UCV30867.1 RNA methyltransferase [Ferribacterium limneticum]
MKLIQSRDNAFFKQLKRLAESGRERRKTGQTLLDGVHLVEAYEKAFGPLENLIVAESALAGGEIAAYLEGRQPVVLADALMRDLGLVDTPSGLLAVAPMPQQTAAIDLGNDAVLLDGVQDPGNVGTLLRTAAASGVKQVLLAPGCASAWSPKVLRAGQGAHFVLVIHEEADLAAFMADYRGTTAVTCLDGATSLYEARWTGPLAWVFGAEGLGVRRELIEAAKLRIKIPMPGAVESLNVGAAAAVCLFEALRRRLG